MKKNRMMRLASVLMVAVMMTTCTISGTFAKYVTSAEAMDTARVAKWGVTVATTVNAFAEAYNDETDESASTVVSVNWDAATDDGSEDNVIAPGTSGLLANASISGSPEVDVEVKKEATLVLAGWLVDGKFYCPLIIAGIDGKLYPDDEAGFIAAVEAAIEGADNVYHANTDLSTVGEGVNVTWEWPFYTSEDGDVKDTKLGDAAADDSASTISFTLKTTVTQVD